MAWFGRSVDLGGDLACVTATFRFAVFVFRFNNGEWTQIQKISLDKPVESCYISGSIIVAHTVNSEEDNMLEYWDKLHIWEYNQVEEAYVALQAPISVNWKTVALSEDYLAFSTMKAKTIACSCMPLAPGVIGSIWMGVRFVPRCVRKAHTEGA